MSPHRWPAAAWVAAGVLFALLATANAAGYRFGTSDQAFYIPAVTRALEPASFPQDAPLIDAQARLMVLDELIAGVMHATGIPLETLFLAGYLISLALIWLALVLIGVRVYTSPLLILALGAAFTMRHRIARTSANSFEPYFHPRMLAFGIGMLAMAALLRRRSWLAIALVAAAALVHVTTAIWFAVAIGVALATLDRQFRLLALAGGAAALALLAWAATAGPLREALVVMDDPWLQAVASKDSLFADQWPLWAWVSNLGMLAVLWWAHGVRRRRGTASDADHALVLGATALVGLFLATLPFVIARVSLAVEFQISRVFWLVDLIATIYALAALAELGRTVGSNAGSARAVPGGVLARPAIARTPVATALAALLIAVSVSRGLYVTFLEHPERPLFDVSVPASPWIDAMTWLGRQPMDIHVLADPGHAWKYGTSVRATAGRDVFLEEVKDSAVGMYSRAVALRVIERTAAVGDFTTLTPDRIRALAAQYRLDYLVTEADLPLPVAYRNARFRIYALAPADAPARASHP